MKVFIAAGDRKWSGYTAKALLNTNATVVGMAIDTMPHLVKVAVANKFSWHQKLVWHVGLAQRLPRTYVKLLKSRLVARVGRQPTSDYQALQKAGQHSRQLLERELGASARLLPQVPLHFPSLSEVAAEHNIPLFEVTDFNSPDAIRLITKYQPDVIVGQGTQILKPDFLKIPKLGVLNGHSSLLPNYRGGAVEFWQLAAREAYTGVSIHWMNRRLDAGAIVAQESWPILPGSNHHQLRKLSLIKRSSLWQQAIEQIMDGNLGSDQQVTAGKVYRFPTLQQLYSFYVEELPLQDILDLGHLQRNG